MKILKESDVRRSLSNTNNLFTLFLEKYVVYMNLVEKLRWRIRISFEELSKVLLNAFAPRSNFVFYGLLQQVQIRMFGVY